MNENIQYNFILLIINQILITILNILQDIIYYLNSINSINTNVSNKKYDYILVRINDTNTNYKNNSTTNYKIN